MMVQIEIGDNKTVLKACNQHNTDKHKTYYPRYL